MQQNPLIKIRNLSVIYDKGAPAEMMALKGINLEIYEGEFIIIFGPSGCGKSTLLYTLSGAERRIEAGDIWIRGKNLSAMDKQELTDFHRESVGMVFQAYNLIPTVNVFENITLPLVFRGVSRSDRLKRGKELMERFSISDLADKFPSQLSGGQQQRVGLARALVNDTEIVLADEPTGNLDSKSAINAMDIFTEINVNTKKTVILVTHESQYLPYASRIIYMKDGKNIKDVSQQRNKVSHVVGHDQLSRGWYINTERLVGYLDLNLDVEERVKFDSIIAEYVSSKITQEKFEELLDKPFVAGGLGMYKQKAMRLSEEISILIRLFKFLGDMDTSNKKDLSEKTSALTGWLLNDYAGNLSDKQKEKIRDAVLAKIKGETSLTQFQNQLDMPAKDGGAGLNWSTAKNLAQKIGIIL
ncbi:MAG: ABC transporter ATP-binding protein [bacterium]|nr:ABC transporter ATP-binding protein [bacterium]